MSKDAYYFPHDSNARHDPKTLALMSVYGAAGYGYYWMLIEILREQKDYKYPINNKYAYHVLGKEMGKDFDFAVRFITDCVSEFGLLSEDKEFLWSESLCDRMKPLDSRRKQATDAANKRWKKKPKKEEKEVEEEKSPSTPEAYDPFKVKSLDVLKKDAVFASLMQQMWEQPQFKTVAKTLLMQERDRCLDWLSSKGRKYKDYRAFFKNWMRNVLDRQKQTKSGDGMVF